MMYSNRFVVAVKVSGKVLRENKDSVHLPFGSEYTLLLKNLEARRSQVSVAIDGEDVATNLVIDGNISIELERYIRNGNLESGNRFKFIERSETIESHRGVKAEDGLIRVEFQFERPQPEIREEIVRERREPYWPPRPTPRHWYPHRPGYRDLFPPRIRAGSRTPMRALRTASAAPRMDSGRPTRFAGITVPGGRSDQRFHLVSGFPLEENAHVIVLRLFGMVGELPISKPITVKEKLECSICGKSNTSDANCCAECGTSLVLI